VTLTADTAAYTLDESVYAVRRARLDGKTNSLELVNAAQLDALCPGWDDADLTSAGTPRYAVFDLDQQQLRLHPRPDDEGTVLLTVWRRPTENERLIDLHDEPACPKHMHRHLKHWIAHEVFSEKDGELHDPELAARELQLFEAAVGARVSAHALRLMSTSRIRGVTPHFV
jgi:hypothetical protein